MPGGHSGEVGREVPRFLCGHLPEKEESDWSALIRRRLIVGGVWETSPANGEKRRSEPLLQATPTSKIVGD